MLHTKHARVFYFLLLHCAGGKEVWAPWINEWVRLIQRGAFLLWVDHLMLRLFFFWLGFIHSPSLASPVTFRRNRVFVPFFLWGPDVLLICLCFFTPPPTNVLLTYLWFGSQIDVGWNDSHFISKKNNQGYFWEPVKTKAFAVLASQLLLKLSLPPRILIISHSQKRPARILHFWRGSNYRPFPACQHNADLFCCIPPIRIGPAKDT